MDNPIIERDVVLIGKTSEGNDTFDFPVTRLANIENDAEIKAAPESGDYFPVIDNSDGGKMKKTAMGGILAPLNEHIGDNVRHLTAEERSAWNSKANGEHTHDNRYYTKAETDNKLLKKSDLGHTHSASEISELPTSLPANGGNSDTVDGKHAADFAAASHTHDDRYYTETETNTKLADKAEKNHSHSSASQSADGFMSAADKIKLNGIPNDVKNIRITKGTISVESGFIGNKTVTIPHNVDLFAAYRDSNSPKWGAANGGSADGISVSVTNNNLTATLTVYLASSASTAMTFTYYAFKFV